MRAFRSGGPYRVVQWAARTARWLEQALACAHRIACLPKAASEDTKRFLDTQFESAVLASLSFALTAEDGSFTSPELRANIDRMLKRQAKAN